MLTSFLVVLCCAKWAAANIEDNIFLQHLVDNHDPNDKIVCEKGGSYDLPHKEYCDRLYSCIDGKAYYKECPDGLGFVPYIGCKPLHVVDCGNRHMLQHPKGHGICRRLYGIYDNPRGCGRYYRCVNGSATQGRCPNKYMFNDATKQCRKPTHSEHKKCFHHMNVQHHLPPTPTNIPGAPEMLEVAEIPSLNDYVHGFKCPSANLLPFGQHSRHPYPGNCKLFIICLKEGSAKIGGCEDGAAFSPQTGVCEPEYLVESCRINTF